MKEHVRINLDDSHTNKQGINCKNSEEKAITCHISDYLLYKYFFL